MIRVAITVAIVVLCVVANARAGHAGTRRVAVVVGNNVGGGAQPPLRYAEVDAAKVARVLVELGRVAGEDLFLVQGKGRTELVDVLARASQRIAQHRRRGDRVIAIFYYSGHSDGIALELGRDRFTFAEVRRWLKDTGAELRIGLIDSCKSGALLAVKGGKPGPAFSIRLTDDLSSTGEALLTSSAADENALESAEIGGSFFTHHLVSGLRGAADTSGDGRVTLHEAYQYAYRHTIATSGATLAGAQHPSYEYRLTGQGDLVLTELHQPTASLSVPEEIERVLVRDTTRGHVIAEVVRGGASRIALAPGRYDVRAWRAGRAAEATFALAVGDHRAVAWDGLRPISLVATRAKGEVGVHARALDAPRPYEMSFALGGRAGVAEQLDVLAGVRAGVRSVRAHGPSLALDASTRSADGVREASVLVFAGYRFSTRSGRLRAAFVLEAGGGAVFQHVDRTFSSPAFALAPAAELSVAVTTRVALALETQLAATLLKRDGALDVTALPALWFGAVVQP